MKQFVAFKSFLLYNKTTYRQITLTYRTEHTRGEKSVCVCVCVGGGGGGFGGGGVRGAKKKKKKKKKK